MLISFPTHIVVLIVTMMILTGAGMWFILAQILRRLPLAQSARHIWLWGIAFLLISWLLALLAFAVTAPTGTVLGFEFLILSLGLALLAGLLPLLTSSGFRRALRAVPETWLVGIHAIRIAGFLFLALLDMRLLPAEFALPAGYGDVTVGLLALGSVYLLVKRNPYAPALVIGWTVLGLLDFTVALVTGGLYIPSFAAEVAAELSPNYLNYVLIVPSFGVPLFTLLHIYSLFQLSSGRLGETEPAAKEPVRTPVIQR